MQTLIIALVRWLLVLPVLGFASHVAWQMFVEVGRVR